MFRDGLINLATVPAIAALKSHPNTDTLLKSLAVAIQDTTFTWTREPHDPQTVWLRKRRLDDPEGSSLWSGGAPLELSTPNGSGVTLFLKAG